MLRVLVALPSGRAENLEVPESSKVGDLNFLARRAFKKGFIRLVTADGQILSDPLQTLTSLTSSTMLHRLTAVVRQVKIAATRKAFVLWCDGADRIVTWGDPEWGGDSSAIEHQLKSVQEVQATSRAFAAVLADGSLVTWGDPRFGGDSSTVKDRLQGVQQVRATVHSFAALLADGSVVTWGDAHFGGDSSAVQDRLKNVQQVQATYSAFAAILADGLVVTWGASDYGGDSSAVADQFAYV